jgi:aminoglycoside phosphotransferase (APT) family kinase protein
LTGVVDWTQASTGPHGVDIGHMRSNLAIDVDVDAADAFLDRYRARAGTGATDQAYWDLVTSVDLAAANGSRLAPSAAVRLERFVRESVRRL